MCLRKPPGSGGPTPLPDRRLPRRAAHPRWAGAGADDCALKTVTDDLSGPLSRRAILTRLDAERTRGRRPGRPLAVISVDIDRFKGTNDEHGHAKSDEAIRAVAGAIDGTIRREESAGRLGGDESLIVLPEACGGGAPEVAERVRAPVHEIAITSPRGGAQPVHLTLSPGAASWPETPASDPAKLLHASDQALYQAKAAGRNQSCLCPWFMIMKANLET